MLQTTSPGLRNLRLALLVCALVAGHASCSGDSGSSPGSGSDAGSDLDSGGGSGDTGTPDTGTPDTGTPDTEADAGADTGADSEADSDGLLGVGEACGGDAECDSGLCVAIPGDGGSICTSRCNANADCPRDFDCQPIGEGGVDPLLVCVPTTLCVDEDGDGYGLGPGCAGADCDDTAAGINLRAREVCDGLDNDCDDQVDDDPVDDGERCDTGFPGVCAAGETVCEGGSLSCNPVTPAGTELCDGLDNDCDGTADEGDGGGPLTRRCYDGPTGTAGVGPCSEGRQTCIDGGYSACSAQVLPATEVCDGLDNDCDGTADDDTRDVTWWPDADGDGFGDAAGTTLSSCVPPTGYAQNATDCDDTRADVRPGAVEVPGDGIDQGCDGREDCYVDADGDGYRLTTIVASADADCGDTGEALASLPTGDCNDTSFSIRPGATEAPGDEVDQDCNAVELCYVDADNYGYRTTELVDSPNLSCGNAGEAQDFDPTGDCDDADAARRPGQLEVCNGIDDNCDGRIDEGASARRIYVDADRDGFGDAADPGIESCDVPAGFATSATDCDDTRADVRPGAEELPGDGIDQGCDGSELCFVDADGDGYRLLTTIRSADADCLDAGEAAASLPTGDCNDNSAAIRPGATEVVGDEIDQDCDGGELCYVDADNDGYRTASVVASPNLGCGNAGEAQDFDPTGDCDDSNAARRPGQVEVCNGIDDNCNDRIDEGASARRVYIDADRDGFGDAADPGIESCDVPAGFATSATDCDDSRADVRPGADEVPGDGIDQSCDGRELCFVDADGDGVRTEETIVSRDPDCADADEADALAPDGDCDDLRATVYPGATETRGDGIDQDCDGGEICFVDADGDGFRTMETVASADAFCDGSGEALARAPATDCNDAVATINPVGVELCDGVDQDCNGTADDGLATFAYYPDRDGDGFGDSTASATQSCREVTGQVTNRLDCNDGSSAVRPNATEVPGDGIDQDCNGSEFCFVDADDDGVRPSGGSVTISFDSDCDDSGEATVTDAAGDCNDGNDRIRPGATETVADGIDQDCNGGDVCYVDADGDGYRASAAATVDSTNLVCTDRGEATSAAPLGDCDDLDASRRPGAPELCDGIDNNCSGSIDESVSTVTYYVDADRDGEGDPGQAGIDSCAPIAGYVANNRDCNDARSDVRTTATEVANDGTDQNCDGRELCAADVDADGFVAPNPVLSTSLDCVGPGLGDPRLPGADCDDLDDTIYPGAFEAAGDEVDADCNGGELCFADADNDGYRTAGTVVSGDLRCDGAGEADDATPAGDCNDADRSVRPGAIEACNGFDDNCDGSIDEGVGATPYFVDLDGDGFGDPAVAPLLSCLPVSGRVTLATDCNDADRSVRPGARENVADGIDQDCDGREVCLVDADNDGYRPNGTDVALSFDASCAHSGLATTSTPAGDCADNNPAIRPGATEAVADGIDQDCDGQEICFADADNDGRRPNPPVTVISTNASCADGGEATATAPTTDCNDNVPTIYAGAPEVVADGIDQDCNGGDICYLDADNDGQRPNATSTVASTNLSCADSGEAVASDPTTDCNDAVASIYTGAPELTADGVDQDCNGGELCFADADNDGQRPNANATVTSTNLSCADSGEAVASDPTTDCNDAVASIYAGAPEVTGDDIDQDCNGGEICFVDADNDGYRPASLAVVASADRDCSDPGEAGNAAGTGDCNDSNASLSPGVDADADGVSSCLDCVDTDNLIPGGPRSYAGATGSLPDEQTVNFTVTVNNPGVITDLNVALNITHTFDGDLGISLIGPDGTTVSLSNRNGSSGDNYTNTVFDDEAATPITSGSAPFNGSYRPQASLTGFDGKGITGTWTLRIVDDVARDSGTLNSWSIQATTRCP